MRSPRDFLKPLAIGAPDPVRDVPIKPSRMIHFFDPSNEKMAAKLPDLAKQSDILLGNLEDAIAADKKLAARDGLVRIGREIDLGATADWARVGRVVSHASGGDVAVVARAVGRVAEVVMVPKV